MKLSLFRRTRPFAAAPALFAALVAAFLVPSAAFAQTAGAFDPGSIETLITEYGAMAVGILAAMALALWGIRAILMVKPKG